MATLITGATGFLGQAIVDRLLQDSEKHDSASNPKLVLLGHSEKRADVLRRLHGMPVFVGDIQNEFFLEKIFKSNKIDKIIHTAAIKYVTISNYNPISTVETNIIGSYTLVRLARRYDVEMMVGISTDKAINPVNIYGMTKKIMESMFIEAGYTIVSGVNFFGSSGSVLDVWRGQLKQNKPLTLTDRNCIRYFIGINDVVDLVLGSFGKNEIIYPDTVNKINMGDLLDVFMDIYDYHNFKEVGLESGEKLVEDMWQGIKSVEVDKDYLRKLIKRWEREILISH